MLLKEDRKESGCYSIPTHPHVQQLFHQVVNEKEAKIL